ncbi:MAG: AI-2E family transporter [Alphaproteobacteria bacterium]|nr:AI-2E family transporter [Alphaproteobacteria bacterium]
MDETVAKSAPAGLTAAGWRLGQINIPAAAVQSIARTIRNSVLIALGLVLAWLAINVLLVIFAGILLAIFLRGLADVVQRLSHKFGLHLPIGWALLIAIVGILIILAAISWFFNDQIDSQIAQLSQDLPRAFHNFEDKIRQFYWGRLILNEISPAKIANTTNAGNIAGTVASTVFGVAHVTVEIAAALVIFFFIGLYGAIEPDLYARGAISLVPPTKRPRARYILEQTANTLWYWEMGRLFSMTVIGVVTGIGLWLLGVPVPGALGLLAGILTFVPYAGTVISAIPAALLAFTIGSELALYTVLLYVGAHTLEGYILVPLVQKRAAHLPPALTLSAQAILSVIVGIAGLALATPITAAAVVLTRMVYVEGMLDASTEAAADPKQG